MATERQSGTSIPDIEAEELPRLSIEPISQRTDNGAQHDGESSILFPEEDSQHTNEQSAQRLSDAGQESPTEQSGVFETNITSRPQPGSDEQVTVVPVDPFPSLTEEPTTVTEDGGVTGQSQADTILPPTSAPELLPSDLLGSLMVVTTPESVPPPPLDVDSDTEVDHIPEWVKYEEDTSTPDEEELKEIEANEDSLDASDISAIEKAFYTDVDDPDQRPIKKIRLSWVFKGVRGSKEKPNLARVMSSPSVCIDGKYWYIKFFPRGNKCSSLSAYIRCCKNPPRPDDDVPETTFTCFEGPPDADLSNESEPKMKLTVPASTFKVESDDDLHNLADLKKNATGETSGTLPEATGSHNDLAVVDDSNNDDDDEVSSEEADRLDKSSDEDVEDWRIPAQLGMVIYNPDEPRTCYDMTVEHQFSRFNDDWGWTNFVSNWEDIHRRKRGQRQALLRNDTLAIDAYIRIFDDPSQSLWWHAADAESQWDSKVLAGYYPMGTPGLYHSPAVAGITAWSLLAPFRSIIQEADAGQWRFDSSQRPRPLIAQMQLMLFLMRYMRKEEIYINVQKVISELMGTGETFEDTKKFWEVFRRGIELELRDEPQALVMLNVIFGTSSVVSAIPTLSVEKVQDMQEAASQAFTNAKFQGKLPDFLPLMLDRQKFDKAAREWKLYHNKVKLNEEIDLSSSTTDTDPRFTLYGFIVHVGERDSGKFYSVIRPNGPGSKWLAFEDGNGNKVFSYTRKRLEKFEGLNGDELQNFSSTRQNAYLAMYIRTSKLSDYLPGELEPYRLPTWLKPYLEAMYRDDPELFDGGAHTSQDDKITVELFADESIKNRRGILSIHSLRNGEGARENMRTMVAIRRATFSDLRLKVASILEIEDVTRIKLWTLNYEGSGSPIKSRIDPVNLNEHVGHNLCTGQILSLWFAVVPDEQGSLILTDVLSKLEGLEIVPSEVETDLPKSTDEARKDHDVALTSVPPPHHEIVDGAEVAEDVQELPEALISEGVAAEPTLDENIAAAPDLEQESVQEAVLATLNGSRERQVEIPEPGRSANSIGLAGSAPEDRETSTTASEPELSDVQDNVGHPPMRSDGSEGWTTPRPVEHGHLVDAASHEDLSALSIENLWGALLPGSISMSQNAIAEINVDINDLSIEDAALINQLISADLEAEGRLTGHIDIEADVEQSVINESVTDTHPPTPRLGRTPMHLYGFLQIFDVEEQTIVTHGPLLAEVHSKVRDVVRKQLGYEESREIKVWRGDGSPDLVPVSLDSLFFELWLRDGSDFIVGDVLSPEQVRKVQADGKFWDPSQLIKYLHMLERQHPILARTTTESIEIADFGADYYRGTLVRGQYHGTRCFMITSAGHIYDGPLVAGMKCGSDGTMTYQNGDVYKGEWFNDDRHGQGELLWKRTGNRYVGGFENDKRWGKGVTYWEVADEQADMCQICYGEEIDALFYDCGHVCACVECAKQCDCCPICRKSIKKVVKIFRA